MMRDFDDIMVPLQLNLTSQGCIDKDVRMSVHLPVSSLLAQSLAPSLLQRWSYAVPACANGPGKGSKVYLLWQMNHEMHTPACAALPDMVVRVLCA